MRVMRGFVVGICAAAVAATTASVAGATAPDTPETAPTASAPAPSAAVAVIAALNEALHATLRDAETLGYQGRYERLAPAIDAAFDLAFMAEKSVGRHWRRLDRADRTRWVETFGELTRANYAGRFDRYSGQRFELLGEEPGANGTRIVRTKVTSPGDDDVELSYRLHETDAGWRVIDVYLKGTVSELALRRSEYASVLKRDGFDSLVATLRGKITALAAGEEI